MRFGAYSLRSVWRLAPTIGLLAVVASIISAGFSAGFDRRIPPNEWGRFVFALSSAITAQVYGIRGYVVFEPVEAALHAGGLTGNPKTLSEIGRTFPENFYDQDLIDRAISQASRLKIPIPPPESQNEKYNVRPAPGEDLGLVTLFIIAFNLFSHSIKAIYLTYLLFLATSVLLFW